MKKFILLFLIAPIFACTAIKTAAVYEVTAIDYSRYTNKGFYITTSLDVNFEYQAIGSLTANFLNGYDPIVEGENFVYIDLIDGSKVKKTSDKYIAGTPQGVMDLLYEKCVEMKANGIINLKINYVSKINPETLVAQNGYEGTGIAIVK